MELIVFHNRHRTHLTGGHIYGGHYLDKGTQHRLPTVPSLWYLGVFLTEDLQWQKHVSIMVNHARSTI